MKIKRSNLTLFIAFIIVILSIIAIAFHIRISLMTSISEDDKMLRREVIERFSNNSIENKDIDNNAELEIEIKESIIDQKKKDDNGENNKF